MAQEPRLVNLTNLFFSVNSALDAGHNPSIDEVQNAMENGEVMDFLSQYDETNLSSFTDDSI